jgi:hypothetical protein
MNIQTAPVVFERDGCLRHAWLFGPSDA